MELQLRVVAFKSPHLDDACFFKEFESQDVIADLSCVLDNSSQSMDDVHQVVALIIYFVNLGGTLTELALESIGNCSLNDLRVRLVTHLVYILFVDHFVKTGGCCLQVVEGISHVSFCSED